MDSIVAVKGTTILFLLLIVDFKKNKNKSVARCGSGHQVFHSGDDIDGITV
jgi:hypothetical protein